jgi:hypothetical protein
MCIKNIAQMKSDRNNNVERLEKLFNVKKRVYKSCRVGLTFKKLTHHNKSKETQQAHVHFILRPYRYCLFGNCTKKVTFQ